MIVLREATVVDGSGGPEFIADVAVDGELIAEVGSVSTSATQDIDAKGMVVAPGFVDTHTHDDVAVLRYPGMEFKLAQGVTTVVVGNCGFSAAPAAQQALRLFEGIFGTGDIPVDWDDQAGYLRAVRERRPAVNVAALIGHSTLRLAVMGTERRAPTAQELDRMRNLVREAMQQGARGLTTGLIYTPGRFADTEEIAALAAEIAPYAGVYASHMRNEADKLLDAVEETISIGRAAGCAVHISHHKAAGRPNWGKVVESLRRVDAYRESGVDVTLDVYPYTAASSRLGAYVEIGAVNEDSADATRLASSPTHRRYEGWSVRAIADDMGCDVAEACRRLLAGDGRHSVAILDVMSEADIEENLRHPQVMVGSDGIPVLEGKPHPRLFGTFPRVLGRYVRDKGVIGLAEAVRKMSSLSCERFGISDRGTLRAGMAADLVMFDPATVIDLATYDDPMCEPRGIHLVMVNGKIAYRDGRHTGAGAGRVLPGASAV